MCGIFGFFSKDKEITHRELSRSIRALGNRGPDHAGAELFKGSSTGAFTADAIPEGAWTACLAHTRLSIIDLSDAGSQPMCNEDSSVWIVYNGEIYNFMELRSELLSLGHVFRSGTDTEVIVHGYEQWGDEVVQRLRGMFAFVIYDMRNDRIVLARDRLGVKPLKYYYDGRTLVFASSLFGLQHLVPCNLNMNGLNKYLYLKYIPSPDTILESCRKVRPGEILKLDFITGSLSGEKYWAPSFSTVTDCTFSDARDRFRQILSESVLMRTISDVPIGVFLSGGMDSGAITAFLKDNGIDDINTFTMKFNRQGYDESGYAERVARHFHTRHHEFRIPDLTLADINSAVDSLDEPFGDPSYIPTYFLARFTAPHVKVVLSGDGGDELLGGYKRYHIHARNRYLSLLPGISANLANVFPPEIDKKCLSGRIQKIIEELSAGFWNAYLLRFSGLNRSFKRLVLTPEMCSSMHGLSIDDITEDFSKSASISNTIERLLWIDMHTYLPDYILAKTDMALMAHSVEGRNPFVDHRLVEYSNSLPPAFKFRGTGKHILKKVLEDYLPHDVLNRKKMGFSPPIKYWFREKPGLLYDIFSPGEFISGDIFDLTRIRGMINRMETSDINISEQLWQLVVFELWRRNLKQRTE